MRYARKVTEGQSCGIIPGVKRSICMDKKMKFWSVKMSDKKTSCENGTITDFYDVDGTTYMGIACDGKLLLIDVFNISSEIISPNVAVAV